MNIERKIVIGLITSTDYIKEIARVWDVSLLASPVSRQVAQWAMEYYDKYDKAPGKDIQTIFFTKAEHIDKDIAEEIEEDYLPDLAEESQESMNVQYLLDKSFEYFRLRHLENFSENIQGLVMSDEILDAEKLAMDYKPLAKDIGTDIDFKNETTLDKIDKAFTKSAENLIEYPGALGELWNEYFKRDGFIALMAPEKRGKTFWLMELAVRASRQKRKVAFFQAGDMTEDEQMMRFCIHLAGRSNKKKYSGYMHQPIKDCIHNQLNTCKKPERECDFGVFEEWVESELRNQIDLDMLKDAYQENKEEYRSCYNCLEYPTAHGWGMPWLEFIDAKEPLDRVRAKRIFEAFFTNKRPFKLSTHINNTLSIKQIRALLDIWEKQDDFIPDVIVIDYADLLVPDVSTEFRHQQHELWKTLRGLSQERHVLLITATQADAKSYEKDRLGMINYSEDKRKLGHVTAMYGLNQDHKGREKAIKLMRINEIVKREGEFFPNREVTILQNLSRGKPYLGSYWT
jgi:replicative DNA helicase